MSSTRIHEVLPTIDQCWGDLSHQLRQNFTNTRDFHLEDSRAGQQQDVCQSSCGAKTQSDCDSSQTNVCKSNSDKTERSWTQDGILIKNRAENGESESFDQNRKRKKSYEDAGEVELPPGTSPLAHQVAGHRKGPGSMVMLKCDGGHVLKHVQRPPKGYREVEFYRQVFHCDISDPVLLSLRRFVPTFYGTLPEGPVEKVTFFKMADVTEQFVKPCISDIKMGRLTYDPLASKEKQYYELTKYPPGINLGIQMLGMRVYNRATQKVDVYDRKYGRSLAENEVVEKGLVVYFGGRDQLRRDAMRCMLGKLRRVKAWFDTQSQLAFYASSLLLMYEGSELCHQVDSKSVDRDDADKESAIVRKCQVCKHKCVADVKMIDFAHVFEVTEPDENYLFGLRTLINMLEQLL